MAHRVIGPTISVGCAIIHIFNKKTEESHQVHIKNTGLTPFILLSGRNRVLIRRIVETSSPLPRARHLWINLPMRGKKHFSSLQ
jgi:hypothetical protein